MMLQSLCRILRWRVGAGWVHPAPLNPTILRFTAHLLRNKITGNLGLSASVAIAGKVSLFKNHSLWAVKGLRHFSHQLFLHHTKTPRKHLGWVLQSNRNPQNPNCNPSTERNNLLNKPHLTTEQAFGPKLPAWWVLNTSSLELHCHRIHLCIPRAQKGEQNTSHLSDLTAPRPLVTP